MYRACLFGAQISDISNQEKRKRLPTGKKTFFSVAFDVKNYYSGLFYSRSTVESVNSLLKKILQTINLAGSWWVPLFPELLLSVLHSIALRTDDVTKTCPPSPHRDSDKHWPFLLEVARTMYGNAQFAISSARRFSVFRRVPVSKFEELPRKYNVEQILFIFIFILFYLPTNNYKKYRKRRKKEVARRPNRNYRSL